MLLTRFLSEGEEVLLLREAFKNKHCEVLVSCSDWVDWIDFIELHACNMLSKAVISTACQL